jgi:TonB family protein
MIYTVSASRCAALAWLALTAGAATASVPADLDTLAPPRRCAFNAFAIGNIADERDKGMTLTAAQERNRSAQLDAALPEQMISHVFAYPALNRHALVAYAMSTCHANGHGLPVLALKTVHTALAACYAKPAGDACVRQLRDKVMGIKHDGAPSPMAETPDMLEIKIHPSNKAPPQDTVTHMPLAGSCAKPEYPRESLVNEETGAVTVRLLVDAEGSVLSGKIAKSSGYERLDQEVLRAMSLCKYRPLIRNGKAESGFIRAGYTFTLE